MITIDKNLNKLPHIPVMLDEVVRSLSPKDGENYLDCTFGAGGYSKAILDSCNCHITALDQDKSVEIYADHLSEKYQSRFNFINTNFAENHGTFKEFQFNGIVLDLGVSSMQLDNGNRGFSFTRDGPLDMRMGQFGVKAEDFINEASEELIANIIYKYGDEVASRKIAKNIVLARSIERIDTTAKLSKIVRDTIGFRKSKIDPATKTFQAIRIYINDELNCLEKFLANVKNILTKDGRLIVVSFHSLEDLIVKNFFKENAMQKIARSKYSKAPPEHQPNKWLKLLNTKPLLPSKKEIKLNPRSRSAKLRAAIKVEV